MSAKGNMFISIVLMIRQTIIVTKHVKNTPKAFINYNIA